MTDKDLLATTQTALKSGVPDFKLGGAMLDEEGTGKPTIIYNDKWREYLDYYFNSDQFNKAIGSLMMWAFGRGYNTDSQTRSILEHINGRGNDSFDNIMWNMGVVKKINGDAFLEIIRKGRDLLNLKPISPLNIATQINNKGIITGYLEINPKTKAIRNTFKPNEIFHISNDRIANSARGISAVISTKFIIDSKMEAERDWRRVLHRSTIRVMYIDADDTPRLNRIKAQYKDAIKNGELMIIPAKKGEAEFQDITVPPFQPFADTMRYYDSRLQQALGVPKITLGGAEETTEAASKVATFTYEVPYVWEQRQMEMDFWNQVGLMIKFFKPPSLKDNIQSDEEANTGQLNIQPNETEVGLTRTE